MTKNEKRDFNSFGEFGGGVALERKSRAGRAGQEVVGNKKNLIR